MINHKNVDIQKIQTMAETTYENTPNRTVDVGGTTFAYRELGVTSGVPVIFLHHLGAVLDNFDPRIVGGLAAISTGEPS